MLVAAQPTGVGVVGVGAVGVGAVGVGAVEVGVTGGAAQELLTKTQVIIPPFN